MELISEDMPPLRPPRRQVPQFGVSRRRRRQTPPQSSSLIPDDHHWQRQREKISMAYYMLDDDFHDEGVLFDNNDHNDDHDQDSDDTTTTTTVTVGTNTLGVLEWIYSNGIQLIFIVKTQLSELFQITYRSMYQRIVTQTQVKKREFQQIRSDCTFPQAYFTLPFMSSRFFSSNSSLGWTDRIESLCQYSIASHDYLLE